MADVCQDSWQENFYPLASRFPKITSIFEVNVAVFSAFIPSRTLTTIVTPSDRFIETFPMMPLFSFMKDHKGLDYFYFCMEQHDMVRTLKFLQWISNKRCVTVTLWSAFSRKLFTQHVAQRIFLECVLSDKGYDTLRVFADDGEHYYIILPQSPEYLPHRWTGVCSCLRSLKVVC